MRSRLYILTATGLAGLAGARYIPRQQAHSSEYDGQKSLFKRQMQENAYNPFAPLTNPQNPPNINPQNVVPNLNPQNVVPTLNLAGQDDQAQEDVAQAGDGTPTFQGQGLNAIDRGNDEDLATLGMASTLGRLDLSGLVNGPYVIQPTIMNAPVELQTEQIPVNDGEDYEYAPFIQDPYEPDWNAFPWLKRNPNWGQRSEPQSPQARPTLPRRPPGEPKYSPCGRRMGYVLNRSVWLDSGGYQDLPPTWQVIEAGDEVAEEPEYLDDDLEINWTEEQIRECERALSENLCMGCPFLLIQN
ncbi:hypothetical protein ABW21_db0201930 [Orbilia brochopaga]|nr:hypothetical protein ABW21_db0201930 [Drechslerella brochopaga]